MAGWRKNGGGAEMKLGEEGRKRLEAMKKALSAGVPLAGLLTAGALSAGCGDFAVQGRMPCPPEQQGERVVMGEPAVDEVQEAAPAQETPADNGEMETERIPYPSMSGAPVPTETDAPAEAETEALVKESELVIAEDAVTMGLTLSEFPPKAEPPPMEAEDAEVFVEDGYLVVDDTPPPPGDAP